MTFDEFRQLAAEPPCKDEPTVFRIRIYLVDIDSVDENSDISYEDQETLPAEEIERRRVYYPSYGLRHYREFYAQDLAGAEAIVKEQAAALAEQDEMVYCFEVDELPFGENVMGDYVSSRLYDANGKLLDQSLCSTFFNDERDDYRHFRGRTTEQLRFAKGDIVEVMYGDSVELAIVVGVPASIDWCYRYGLRVVESMRKRCPEMSEEELTRLSFSKWYMLDTTDDSYTVIYEPTRSFANKDGKQELHWPHSHVSSLQLFKPRFRIPGNILLQMKEHYEQYISSR